MSNGVRRVANKLLTLVVVREPTRVLLGMKKRGFGVGKWNGFGGKVHVGETIVEAAKRELKEETTIEVDDLSEVGLLMFEFVGEVQLMEVHVFTTQKYTGTPTETEEMRPQWFDLASIPYDLMWKDDILWYPLMFKGAKFAGYFKFEGHDKMLEHNLCEVDTIEGQFAHLR